MQHKKKVSILLIFIMIFSLNMQLGLGAYTETLPYSGVGVSTGHAFPINVLIGPDEMLYVTEYTGNKIIKMDKNGQNKTTFATGFSQPIGMCFDGSGNLYVAEHNASKVTKISTTGTTSLVKSVGSGFLTGLVINSQNKIFVLDYTNGRIYKMDLDGSNFSTFKTGLGNSALIGMAIDAQDNLYVSDRVNGKILKVQPDGTTSDFVTGISTAQSVCLGEDGYFYASSSSRYIEKIGTNGTKLSTFSTGNFIPWGLDVDKDGYIYFGESSSAVNKIVGSSETLNTTSLSLNLLKAIDGTVADPSAFTITGAATNPVVTHAVVSGSSVTLTLNNAMSTLDSNIKVNYSRTGTNNLLVSGTATEFNNFTNLTVKNSILRVLSVAAIPQINVANGTNLSAINLPSHVTLNLSNNTTSSAAVTWNGGTPVYDGNTGGNYVFSGTLSVSGNVSNPNNVMASVTVNVATMTTPNIDSVGSLSDIGVVSGTSMGAISLPSSVTVNLSNATTSGAAITWNGGTPAYDGNTPGTYVFSGTLNTGASMTNTNNLKASVNVVVGVPSIVSVASLSNITVSNGTPLANIGLPHVVNVNLNNSTTSGAAVIWNGGTPTYNGNLPGTYAFIGTISSGSSILNPNNLTAGISVVVPAAGGSGDSKEPTPVNPATSDTSDTSNTPAKTTTTTPPVKPGADVIVNGIKASAGIENTVIIGNRTVKELTVNAITINTMISQALSNIASAQANNMPVPTANTVRIPVTDTASDVITVKLTGDIVKRLDDNKFSITIETNKGNYILPAKEMKISEIAKQFNLVTDLQKIVVDIQVNVSLPAVTERLNTAVKTKSNMVVVSQPIEFKITASTSVTKETVEISKFTSYVEREVLLPSTVDVSKITTGVLIEPNGQLIHIPTKIFSLNNKNYANLQSLTNSDYSVVYNPVTVTSVKGHWSQIAVNDLASRLIIDNATSFDPNAKITRGEFATMLVKALGLYRTEGPKLTFNDVKTTDANAVGIAFAAEYKLISGYSDGSFKAEKQITRQEAMVILTKAMNLASLSYDTLSNLASYSDESQVAEWAKKAAAAVISAKVMVGVGNNKLDPNATFTTAEAASAIRNLLIYGDMINK